MKVKYLNRIICSVIVIFFFFSTSLLAKDIFYQAEVINNYSDSSFRLRWTNYVKALNENSAPYDYESSGTIESNSILDNYGGSGWYQTRGMTFHEQPMTIYSDSKGGDAYFAAFDYNSQPFKLYVGDGNDEVHDLDTYRSKVNMGAAWLNGINENYGEILTVDNWNNEHNGYDVYNVKGKTNDYFTINTFELNNIASKDLYDKLKSKYNSDSVFNVYFSGQLHTTWGTEGTYKTAYEFVKNMGTGKGWENSNYGFGPINSWTYDPKIYHNVGTDGVKARSVLNNFDNILSIPVSKRNVFVAHVIEGSDNEKITSFTNSELDTVSSGVVYNRYSPGTIDQNGWQEKYTTLDGVKTLSLNKGASQVEYNGATYDCVEARVFLLDGHTDWSNPVWSGAVTASTVDPGDQDYGVIYYYRKTNITIEQDVQVYVNYIDQSENEPIESFKVSLDTSSLGDLKSTTVDKTPYPHKFIMNIDESGGVYVRSSIYNKTELLNYNGKNYEYVGVKSAYGNDYQEACRSGNANSAASPRNIRGVSISKPGEQRVYIVSFYFKPSGGTSGGDPEQKDPKVEGRLDFINTDTQFKSATYTNTSNDSGGASSLDFIPASEYLSPYIYGAQPYFIKAVDYSSGSTSEEISVTLKGEWTESTGHTESCSPDCTSSHEVTKSNSYTYNVVVNHKFYKIDNLITYRISEVEVNDSNSNIGGKLFTASDSFTLSTSDTYNNRSKASITDHNLEVSFSYSSSTVNAGSDPSASDVASKAGLKVVGKAANDYINLDGSDSVVNKNEKEINVSISSESNTININTQNSNNYLKNIDNYMKGNVSGKYTTYEDFNYSGNLKQVDSSIQNGIRQLKGVITYKKENIRGGNSTFTADKVLNNINDINTIEKNQKVIISKVSDSFSNNYDNEGDDNANQVRRVNVLTPLSIKASIDTGDSVNHSNVNNSILQTGKEFTLIVEPQSYTKIGYNNVATSKYLKGYYITFDFKLKYTGGNSAKVYNGSGGWRTLHTGDVIEANTDIYVDGSNRIEFKGISTETDDYMSAWSTSNNISVVAIPKTILNTKLKQVFDSDKLNINASDFTDFSNWIARFSSWGNFFNFDKYIDSSSSTMPTSNRKGLTAQVTDNLLKRSDLYASANHAVRTRITTNNVGRIFGFIVTDCNDLGYKKVFRKQSDENSNVNEHSNIVYYSGKKYFDYSNMLNLSDAFMSEDSGRSTLLPLGPYKNTESTYIFAPKLGYRISYNLKTSGYYTRGNSQKRIEITPSYYYLSKSGEYKENITLYYKDSSGKYRKFTGSGYNIYFKPNDGYRYGISDSNIDVTDYGNLSTKLESLSISSTIKLNTNMMLLENSGYIQNWYGEFKLPNSTIAVNNEDPNSNINNPLQDGYIGVIFKIKSVETRDGTTIETYYDQNDKTTGSLQNTSQWDYEGYMGVTAGQPANISLQLQKGPWRIDNGTYQKIKGTVILYDIDDRAANDFN